MSDSRQSNGDMSPPLSAFELVKRSRHNERPLTMDFIERLFEDFVELHGDRYFADDPAIIGGMARFGNFPVAVIGQQGGRDAAMRRFRSFAMVKPEGYRKVQRIVKLAEKFGRPVFTFIDTPGGFPGIDAEERGEAEAIASTLLTLAGLRVPIIVTVIGQGGGAGALAIGVGDQVLMFEHSTYSVISPEGCAALIWRDASMAPIAAEALHLTADHLLQHGVIDRVVAEPLDGAHNSFDEAARLLRAALTDCFESVINLTAEERARLRYRKLRSFGQAGLHI